MLFGKSQNPNVLPCLLRLNGPLTYRPSWHGRQQGVTDSLFCWLCVPHSSAGLSLPLTGSGLQF